MTYTSAAPIAWYRSRIAEVQSERKRISRASVRYTVARTVVFIAAIASLWAADANPGDSRVPLLFLAIGFVLVFGVLVALHGRLRARNRIQSALLRLNAEGIARLERDWDTLAEVSTREPGASAEHAYAHDLNLFGPTSLWSLLGSPGTPGGVARLRSWLMDEAEPAAISRRQTLVRALAPALPKRQRFMAFARAHPTLSLDHYETFLDWATGGETTLTEAPSLERRVLERLGRPLGLVLPLVTLIAAAGWIDGWIPGAWWIPLVVVQAFLGMRARAQWGSSLAAVLSEESWIAGFSGLYPAALELPAESEELGALIEEIGDRERGATRAFRRLRRLSDFAAAHRSSFFLLLDAIVLWDLNLLVRLERWRETNRFQIERWIDALSEIDALICVANLHFDHPEWCFPELSLVESDSRVVEATALGHPLLPPDRCVRNDVRLGPPGRFLYITGSNMSGKSTLVRSIGTNLVLTQCGAPVCATRFRTPPFRLWTTIEVHDSIADGVSYYMAQLLRLRDVLSASLGPPPDRGVFIYLFDEILRGTNSAERREAARRILEEMVVGESIGAVTSHDLELLANSPLEARATAVHFRETISPGAETEMSFDYRLRAGLATSSNALKLLEIVGISGSSASVGSHDPSDESGQPASR